MNRSGGLVTSCAIIALPAILSAQEATLEICNKGPIAINVAYAARIQLFITGYRWETSGWYAVDPGACKVVYDEDYADAGPITPQSGARIALVAQTGPTWRAYHSSEVDKHSWMQSGTGQICADVGANSGFRYKEPAGDPAADCSDGMLVPVAYDFMPTGPGEYSYTTNWHGGLPSVAIGKTAPSTDVAATPAPPPAAALAAAPGGASITYLCSSNDPRQSVVYFSDIFDFPDAGSEADNFVTFELIKIDFQLYLIDKYTYSGDEGQVGCVYASDDPNAGAVAAARKQSMEADVKAAHKQVVETGWKYSRPQAAADAADQGATRADLEALNAKGRAALLQWVREDFTAYLDASRSGFDAYKSGDVILSQGYRMWTSSEKPAAARGCWVIQGDSTSTLSCAIPVDKNLGRAYYDALTQDVAASLPADWAAVAGAPFGGNLPSAGYRSTSGAHGEVWLVETAGGEYEVNFQLVSAPTGQQPVKPSDDDPIGAGGFIGRPTAPRPDSTGGRTRRW